MSIVQVRGYHYLDKQTQLIEQAEYILHKKWVGAALNTSYHKGETTQRNMREKAEQYTEVNSP